ncbi:hybrid sensor histidine kinase/response regulator [Azospirillum sp. sgz301742]
MPRIPISRRLIFLLPLVALPLLAFEIGSQIVLRETRKAEVRQDALRLLDSVEAEQQRLIDDIEHTLITLAEVGAAELQGSGCQSALDRLKRRYPPYLTIEVTGLDGVVHCSTDRQRIGVSNGDREDVRRALATGRFAAGTYDLARQTGSPILPFGLPFQDPGGHTVGVITALLDIGWLEDYLTRKPMPNSAAVLIADRSGTVLVRTPHIPGLVGGPLPERFSFMLKGSQHAIIEAISLDGVPRVIAYSTTESGVPGLLISAALDKDEAMRPVNAALMRSLALFASVLLMTVLAALWGVRRFTRLQDRLMLALQSAHAGTFDADLRTGRSRWSEATYRIFGLDPKQHPSSVESWKSVLHPDDRERVLAERLHGFETHSLDHHMEYRIVHPDGGVRWVETLGRAAYAADGTPRNLAGLHIDITRRKEVEEALRTAKEEAERANLSKTKFLAAASHDLRQPMQSMVFFASALHGHVDSSRGREALTMLERGMDTLRGLLDSLLDVSRLDAGVVTPTIEDFSIGPVLNHIGASYTPLAAVKGLTFEMAISCDTPVRSDRNLLGRMVRNLIENAIRYTESGFVRLECHVTSGHVLIEIHDSGIGIPPDQREQIFEEFHQIGNPARDRARGLGLGLSIVKRLSGLLQHPVEVRAAPGRGSVFSIRVPLGQRAAPVAEAAPLPRASGLGRLALLVDDDVIVLLGLQTILREWGYDTMIAASADDALKRLKADGRTPDIVVADYRLREGRTGTEAVRRIREAVGAAVPGIILSGEAGREWQQDAEGLGLGLAFKPVTPRQLHEVMTRHLGTAA